MRTATLRRHDPRHQIAVKRRHRRGDLYLALMPKNGIVPWADAIALHAIVHRQHIDPAFVRQFPHPLIEAADHPLWRTGQPVFVVAEKLRENRQQRLLDDMA